MAKKKIEPPAPAPLVPLTKDAPILLSMNAEATTAMTVASAYVIDSRPMFDIAAEQLADIRRLEKKVETEREKITQPLHQAKTAAIALFKPVESMLATAKRELGNKMIVFEDQERARVQAAEQTALLQRASAVEQTSAKLEEATIALSKGEIAPEDFQQVATEAALAQVSMPMGHVADAPDRGGHARREVFKAEVTDLPAWLEHLAKLLRAGDPTFDNTVEIKIGQLNAFGQQTQGSVLLPGITFRKEASLAARG